MRGQILASLGAGSDCCTVCWGGLAPPGHALVSGNVPEGYAAHEGVAPKAGWRNVAKVARTLGGCKPGATLRTGIV